MKELSIDDIKKIQLEMLDYIHDYCVNNQLKYYLGYGTLLGAIRHNGYIPWDDDIDIIMHRSDYNKIIDGFNKNNSIYKIVSIENTEGYYLPFAKIINTNTVLKERVDINKEIGVYIDLFPIDNLGDTKQSALALQRKGKIERAKLFFKTTSLRGKRAWYKNIVLKIGKRLFKKKSVKSLIIKINNIAQKNYSEKMTKYVGNVVYCVYGTGEILSRESFKKAIMWSFEGREFFIPNGYDDILKSIYGDYMKLPPEEKRIAHHSFKAYWR